MKLELGAGANPNKDSSWIHQDIRDLPGIDLVCNAKELPYINGEVEEIYASHVIEHFGWREVKEVLNEWVRLLRWEGKLELIVPDFYRLWENLVTKRDLPKGKKWKGGPVDSAFVAYVTGGGQDYPENTHLSHYTGEWYRKTLEELDCDVEIKYHGNNHPSPSIRIIAIKQRP